MNLTDNLIKEGWLKTPEIIEAFKKIKRQDFLPEGSKNLADLNEALPIGFGQTISQPLTVAFMLELLKPQAGDKILDVGAGSGWTSALMAFITGKEGKVIAIEIVPELADFGKNNVAKYGFIKNGIVNYMCGDASKGFLPAGRQVKNKEIYDKILVSASSSSDISAELKEQLKIGGRLVCVIRNSVWLYIKKSKNEFEQKEHKGFVFVPLVQKQGFLGNKP